MKTIILSKAKESLGIFGDFISLFYPRLCLSCGNNLPHGEKIMCLPCQYQLPKTNFHLEKDNLFIRQFWGRIPIESAAAFYHFTKGGRTQQLIHGLKYKGNKQVGILLGNMYGKSLKESPLFKTVELIVPVPLHRKKEKKRGFNQSDLFARGLSETMEVPWDKNAVARDEFTQSQTRKSRIDRFENVKEAFRIAKPDLLKDKHVLLVDDVMTTGATLEACGHKILEVEGVRLSFATIAFARN